MIPNTIHFIFLKSQPFSFLHFLAIYCAWKVNRPDTVFLHYDCEPDTVWWHQVRDYVRLHQIENPQEVFGHPLTHVAHKADVIRLQQLQAYGGIYLDLDVICLNPFTPLLRHEMVMGHQAGTGLCNAVILADAKSRLLKTWFDNYRTFNPEDWSRHSVILPFDLAQTHPDWIHVEGPYSFFYPVFNEPAGAYLWAKPVRFKHRAAWMVKRVLDYGSKSKNFHAPLGCIAHTLLPLRWHEHVLAQSYCVHLWAQLWGEPYLKDLTAARILRGESGFARVFRNVIGEDELRRAAALGG